MKAAHLLGIIICAAVIVGLVCLLLWGGKPGLVVENLVISPESVAPGENVTVSVDVANLGEENGTWTVKLRVDGEVVGSRDVTLGPSESKRVSFMVSETSEGTHQVSVDGVSGSFTVVGAITDVYVIMGGSEGDAFSSTLYNGAVDAANQLGKTIEAVWSNWDPAYMVDEFEKITEMYPDGIVVMGHLGDDVFEPLIDEAEGMGIVVTSVNIALPRCENKYKFSGFGYAGQDLYQSGYRLASEAVNRAGLNPGDHVLLLGLKNMEGRGERSRGAEEALLDAGMDVTYQEIPLGVLSDPASGESLIAGYLNTHDYRLVVSDYGQLVARIPDFCKSAGLGPDDVYIAGFDLTSDMVLGIQEGYIDLVLDQYPYLQGYLAVLQIYLYEYGHFTGLHIQTGDCLVDNSNIGELAPLIEDGIRGMSSTHNPIDFSGINIYFFPGGPAGGIFATTVYHGAMAAARDFGVDLAIRWSSWNPELMVSQFKDAVAMDPDGIAIMGHPGVESLGPHVDDAEAKGIIVTSQNVDLPGLQEKYRENGFGYVGQDLYESGYKLALEAIERAGLVSGDRVFLWGLKTRPARGQRSWGAEDALVEAGLIVDYQEITPTVDMDAAAGFVTITGYLSSHPDCKLVITDHGALTATLNTFFMGAGLGPGDVHGVGFDLSIPTIDAFHGGWVDIVLDQQPFLQGYLPVLQICLAKHGHFPGLHVLTGAGLVDINNIDQFGSFIRKGIR